MKNALKISLLAIVISLSVACKGNKSGSSADSAKVDSSTSIKVDSSSTTKVDTAKAATDTSKMKMDTISKSTKKSTETKKTVVKKN